MGANDWCLKRRRSSAGSEEADQMLWASSDGPGDLRVGYEKRFTEPVSEPTAASLQDTPKDAAQ